MCLTGQPPAEPATAADAVAMARAGLSWLAAADTAALTTAEQADCLRALAQAESMHTAARARVLHAFTAQGGYEADGARGARSWLAWQTRAGNGAATLAVRWMQRLAAHPAVAEALAAGEISESWARQICAWTDLLPQDARGDADAILLGAAAGGADLADLGGLAEEMLKRTARPDRDGSDDGFKDRSLSLGVTFRGAGKLNADLTPQATAALQAVLEALGKRAGPEDLRSKWQRQHDALEEALRRLIASGCLPQRAGQPTQIQLHMSLAELLGLPGAAGIAASWPGAPAGPGDDCDATIVPVVTGRVDPDVVDRLAAALLRAAGGQNGANEVTDLAAAGDLAVLGDLATPTGPGRAPGWRGKSTTAAARRARAERATRQLIIARATSILSGPTGLAAYLRTGLLTGPAASISLPLDVGTATRTIPHYLRQAVIARDRHCQFPGCRQPALACQPHHIIPRSQGGKTCLTNLLALCAFHHLIAVHRWGWSIVLMPDGTVTATSPDKTRTLHSHSPPAQAA
jgi:5-methylcytosine-specific restriction endonuclease McrA